MVKTFFDTDTFFGNSNTGSFFPPGNIIQTMLT